MTSIIGSHNLIMFAWQRWSRSGENITSGNMVLNQDFKEFFQSSNNNKVRYLVIGGYAVAFHGHPRYTKDIDIWIDRSEGNAGRIVAALAEFGFGDLGLKKLDFLRAGQVSYSTALALGSSPH